MQTRIRELASHVRFTKVKFTCRTPFAPPHRVVQTIAESSFPKGIQAQYDAAADRTIVQTTLHVESSMKAFFSLEAEVHVRIHYSGQLQKNSRAAKQKVMRRLDELAQRHCVAFVHTNFVDSQRVPPVQE